MAADLNPEWLSCLPSSWSYGVTRDGRVFFINEEAKSTTWLHPVTAEAVVTGHRKTPDLPSGWEEGFTFEGARCFINHNERKVTCKHPVSGLPSQENCIFVVNEHLNYGKLVHPVINRSVPKTPASEKKERPLSTMSEASNYTGGSDHTAHTGHTGSPVGRPSRSSKKVHNFGKRSNSIKRNPNAPVVKSSWLYKQDSSGMKLWKKRWFVLSDMCLFYYRDDKEEAILGSILLPSFHISMLSVDDHINRKYAFKATHPNMRTYYFCTDTAKEMESWMKVMTDAALMHSEPLKRPEKLKVECCGMQEVNNMLNHRVLSRPEAHNNERNREAAHFEERRRKDAERYGFQKDGLERTLTKINSIKLQPAQAAAIAAAVASSRLADGAGPQLSGQRKPPQANGPGERAGDRGLGEAAEAPSQRGRGQAPHHEPERTLQRTNSMQQLEQWVRNQRGRGQEDETRSIMSYQTLPRNMPSHRAQVVPHYPEGYRTLPRNSLVRPESICSVSPSLYERALGPPAADKRRSMRDDTMWQLYEWQQRQAYIRHGGPPPGPYGALPSPRTMVNLSEHAARSIPPSPSHGSLALYQGYSPLRSYNAGSRSEVSSPVFRGDVTIDRRHRTHLTKYAYPPDRRTVPAVAPGQSITPQSLQGKTPEELTLLLIKLRRQQAELSSLREHTLAQLMQLGLDGANPKNEILSHHLQRNLVYLDSQMKENEPLIIAIHTMIENSAPRPQLYQQMNPEDYRDNSFIYRPEELDIDAKLSRLCEQDKVVRTQEEKLQQLYREKHTLETALLSASQEIEMSADNPAAVRSVVQQRDVLQSGLLSTCRELSRVTAELERSWREYDRLESDVSLAKSNLLQQLEAQSPQTEPPSQQHVQIQKELWRIQDVVEALSNNKPPRSTEGMGFLGSKPISSKYKSEEEDSVPPRPPPPQSYDISEQPPAAPPMPPLPPLPSGTVQLHVVRQPLHRPEERKASQRNGTHSGPDYRLYKSEPELTTVAEVDETNGEEKIEPTVEKEPSTTKGISYPVGIVPPRTKSPMPESSTIASYVTLRKSKKPDPRMDHPHGAAEQLCGPECGRPRMSLEEQMERIRRHQEALLKDRKKGSGTPGQENSPSRIPSFSKENPFRTLPNRKREEILSSDIQELEASLREQELLEDHETPAEEIVQLEEVAEPEPFDMERELSTPDTVLMTERCVELDPEETLGPDQGTHARDKEKRIEAPITKNSVRDTEPPELPSPEETEERRDETIDISYELAAETSKHSKLVAVKSLSSQPQSPTSAPPASRPQLADGSHFIPRSGLC
ncbi:LOW QUALITY PROTEIN: pleckstrin homology domain-containing family A member 5-like [Scleropages formosus]|uniref:LOW QUALITY PROTEIN: pleckstrin homology domain-containing family A member 5-like n=1 Tax=Scleropages formosus TaxID=113540 RepID=UPI0010FAA5EC|nr:LOW QUALITY PROTEIN: pleckstrin homology domain-containing family A member 5-like [Scleropages formosus]